MRTEIRLRISVLTVLISLLLTPNARAEYFTKVHGIRIGSHQGYARVVLEAEGGKPLRIGPATHEGISLYFEKLQLMVDPEPLLRKRISEIVAAVSVREEADTSALSFTFRRPGTKVKTLLLPSNPSREGHYRLVIDFNPSATPASKEPPQSPAEAVRGFSKNENKQDTPARGSQTAEARKVELQAETAGIARPTDGDRKPGAENLVPADKDSTSARAALEKQPASELDPSEILRRADQARGNLKGVKWAVKIVSTEGDRKQERELEVKSKAYDFLALFTAPPRVKGQKVLLVDRNMWFMKPGLSKAVPVSPRQRLLGGAAYGDIAATNYANDYEVTNVSEDVFDNETCYLFDLKAMAKNSTYDRIRYWVSKQRTVGVKADFYTVSGKLFKSATFEYKNQVKLQDETRPFVSSMAIKDHLLEGNLTMMSFSAHELVDIPPATFDLNLFMMR